MNEDKALSRKTGGQFLKFATVGVLNTGIDIGILNLIMAITGIYIGEWLILFNGISVSAAIINSYFLNKYWTFGANDTQKQGNEFISFVAVSLGGALINTSVVYLVSTFIDPLFGIDQEIWTNVGKVLAVALAWLWNFSGYKFFVFKK